MSDSGDLRYNITKDDRGCWDEKEWTGSLAACIGFTYILDIAMDAYGRKL